MDRRAVLAAALVLMPMAAAAQGYVGGSLGPNKAPECDKPGDCRFIRGAATTTLALTMPLYDREGRIHSHAQSDRSTESTWWQCIKCGKRWSE